MKKSLLIVIVLVSLFIFSTVKAESFALSATDSCSYGDCGKNNTTSISFSCYQQSSGYDVTVSGLVGVYDPCTDVCKAEQGCGDSCYITYETRGYLLEGATLYAVGTGCQWPSSVQEEPGKILAQGVIKSDSATLHFPPVYASKDYYAQSVVWIIKLTDGTYVWGGHPDSHTCENSFGQPQTWWTIDLNAGTILNPNTQVKTSNGYKSACDVAATLQ